MSEIHEVCLVVGQVPPSPPGTKYVYVIGAKNGPQKIGISARPEERLGELQPNNPYRLRVIYTVVADVRSASLIEKYAHWLLTSSRLRGEWFQVTQEQARDALIGAVEAVKRDDRAPSRSKRPGKVVLTGYVDPVVRQRVAQIAIEQEKELQEVLDEALEMLLAKYPPRPVRAPIPLSLANMAGRENSPESVR